MEPVLTMILRLLLATALGGAIGYEREVHDRPAGLRTHVLVCMGSALIALVSRTFALGSDPTRIAAQIVSGIGFLGAGTILQRGGSVRGLTTAASLWTAAGIGIACAADGYSPVIGVTATVIAVTTLSIMRRLETTSTKGQVVNLQVQMPVDQVHSLGELMQKLDESGITVSSLMCVPAEGKESRTFKLKLDLPATMRSDAVLRLLVKQEGLEDFKVT
jgi:putative Mg2+ transporter-C (MgtC) family protein